VVSGQWSCACSFMKIHEAPAEVQ